MWADRVALMRSIMAARVVVLPDPAAPVTKKERTSPATYFREVRGELKKVAWPTRPEVINSTIIVVIVVIIMTSLIFGLDWAAAKSVLKLYGG